MIDENVIIRGCTLYEQNEEEMGNEVNNVVDKAIVDILSKVEFDDDQDRFVRHIIRNLFLDAYDEGYQEGWDDAIFEEDGDID